MLNRKEEEKAKQIIHFLYSEIRKWYISVEVCARAGTDIMWNFPHGEKLGEIWPGSPANVKRILRERSRKVVRQTCCVGRKFGKT